MPLTIFIEENNVYLEYSPNNGTEYIDKIFERGDSYSVKRTFNLTVNEIAEDMENNPDTKTFIIGKKKNNYYQFSSKILMTNNDVLFHISVNLYPKCFIVNRDISIIRKFEKLANQQIVIGGDKENSIPESIFKDIINSFPSSTEIKHYVDSRITNVLSQYLEGVKDSSKAFERYLENRIKINNVSSILAINSYEYEKYLFILDKLRKMLERSDSYSESDWRNQIIEIVLIIYPKYLKCFPEVKIKDYYSNPEKSTNRFIDLMLVDSNGNVDVIEIKKPFTNCIISRKTYRDNYTPLKELSATIMQVEKYLFHLNKWGIKGEKELSLKYKSYLPKDLNIKITNPKGLVILGRNNNLSKSQIFDLEIIRRKYANLLDIITYDDLIKRLENLLEKFKPNEVNKKQFLKT